MKIERIDHLVLTVKDPEKTVEFYVSVLGMKRMCFGDNRLALQFGQQKINLHKLHDEIEPNAQNATIGSADLCLITSTPVDQAITHLKTHGVSILEGPVHRTGALGPIISIYFRDPDRNLIELSNYPGC